MTDWVEGIEARNYGTKSRIDVRMLSDLLRTIIALALVAGALLFYSWIQNQIVSAGYESQSLFVEEESLQRIQKKLILEEETLRNPARIHIIARNDLGMAPLRPNQLALPQLHSAGISDSNAMAMVDSKPVRLRRAAPMRASANIPVN